MTPAEVSHNPADSADDANLIRDLNNHNSNLSLNLQLLSRLADDDIIETRATPKSSESRNLDEP